MCLNWQHLELIARPLEGWALKYKISANPGGTSHREMSSRMYTAAFPTVRIFTSPLANTRIKNRSTQKLGHQLFKT
jgi:hypothetical protein